MQPLCLKQACIDFPHLDGHGEPDLPRGIGVALCLGEHPLPRLDDVLRQPLDELQHERLQVRDVVAVPRGHGPSVGLRHVCVSIVAEKNCIKL